MMILLSQTPYPHNNPKRQMILCNAEQLKWVGMLLNVMNVDMATLFIIPAETVIVNSVKTFQD